MPTLDSIRVLWDHAAWADREILRALSEREAPDAFREFCHVIGAEAVWIARIEMKTPESPVWPSIARAELEELLGRTHTAYAALLSSLDASDLDREVTYTNSAGRTFTNTIREILLHVALHGQYHRGKINLMLRQAGLDPAPTDFIAYARGAPAATSADSRAAKRK